MQNTGRFTAWLVITGFAAIAAVAAPVRADDPMPGPPRVVPGVAADSAIDVAIVDETGTPVYCTRNAASAHARPDAGGGYRLTALPPGRWMVSLDLPHERVDVLVTVAAAETVVVPPVVARGRCRSITLTRRIDLRQLVEARPATWSVHFDRTYSPRAGLLAGGFHWGRGRR